MTGMAAERRGYEEEDSYEQYYFDFENELNYELPEGYKFRFIET